MSGENTRRWSHIKKLLERNSPFVHPEFEPSPEILTFLQNCCKILVIGAGGLGCELLKDLALTGFTDITVIDMDTIDISNLNRQFLFRQYGIGLTLHHFKTTVKGTSCHLLSVRCAWMDPTSDSDTLVCWPNHLSIHKYPLITFYRKDDVGKAKAEVAAAFINKRVQGCNVTAHCNRIEDFDGDFYRQFHIVVCGLDSIVARRWMNGMLVGLLQYDEDDELIPTSIIPLIDGGTEGFKGNIRVVLPGMTACVECTLDLYPPQVNFPMCTIAHTPRLPAHCVEYVKLLLWPQEHPFGEGVNIDGDDPQHIQWILAKSQERAKEFKITGVTYRFTQGVIKRIIPAVASTNAVIAAACTTEVFKIATNCRMPLKNYLNFNDLQGVYTYSFEAERKPDCLVCSNKPKPLHFTEETKLQEIIDHLVESPTYQMKSPGLRTVLNGKPKTLYMQTVASLKEATKGNLKKTLKELGIESGQQIIVADVTTPNTLTFCLHLTSKMEN